MEFVNNKEPKKVRLGEHGNHWWKTVRTGESVELSEEQGKAYGFEKSDAVEENPEVDEKPETTEGKAGDKTVETKQEEVSENSEEKSEE